MLVADMHVHSNHSRDGKSSVREILEAAVRKGLNALAVTDHDTVDGSLEAMDVVREEHLGITVIPGVEVSTLDGHLLVYGVERDIDPGMSMPETIEVARKYRAVTAIAHPFQFYRHGCIRFWIAKKADAIEVFNAKYITGICNRLSMCLAKAYGKPGIAGSDAHTAREVGKAVTLIEAVGLSYPQVLKAVTSGKTKVRGRRQSFSSWPRLMKR